MADSSMIKKTKAKPKKSVNFSKKDSRSVRDKNNSNDSVIDEGPAKIRKRTLLEDSSSTPPKKAKKSIKNEKENKTKKWSKSNGKDITSGKKSLKPAIKYTKPTNLSSDGKANRKDVKKLFRELKEKRKRIKLTDYETIVKAKKLWEEVRHDECPSEKRAKIIATLFNMFEDKFSKVVFQHDSSRIVQWLLKLGTPAIRLSVTKHLKPLVREMLQKKFSRFCVKNMLKYGDAECRQIVFNEIRGNIVKLMSSAVSAPIVEYAFSRWASSEDKLQFKCEFYGKMLKLMSDVKVTSLDEALTSNIKNDVLSDTKTNILQVIAKHIPVSQVMHSLILEFLNCCGSEDRDEIIEVLYPHVMGLVQTREGAEIAMRCCWFTSGKVKKSMLKNLKGHIIELCSIPFGYWFLMALLDSVDDTVVLRKTLLHEVLSNISDLLPLENGRKVITYLVAHRDTTYFHPQLISLLKTSDSSSFIKKNAEVRRTDILAIIMEPIAKSISQYISHWFQSPSTAIVLMAVLKNAKGEFWLDAVSSIASYLCKDIKVTLNGKHLLLVEHSGFHFAIKKMIENEVDEESHSKLSYQLAKQLTEERIWEWLKCNRGCFILTKILESKNKIAVATLAKKISKDMKNFVGKEKSCGAIALHKIISNVST